MALQHQTKPDIVATVFAGADLEATERARSYFAGYPPSSPSIALMRDGARLVNAARGALVDEDALIEALRDGKLAGAALDVFSTEPYDGPLLELEQVVVTPHLAASTDEAQDRAGLIIAEQVVAALRSAGKMHEYYVYKGEGHGFRTRENMIDSVRRAEEWFGRYLLRA